MVQRCSDKDRLQVMMTAVNKCCRYGGNVADKVFNVEEGNIKFSTNPGDIMQPSEFIKIYAGIKFANLNRILGWHCRSEW